MEASVPTKDTGRSGEGYKPGRLVWIGTVITSVIVAAIVIRLECSSPRGAVRFYPPHSTAWHVIVYLTAIFAVFGVFCILFGIHFQRTRISDEARLWAANVGTWKAILWALWAILPPIWFCIEYFFFCTVCTPPPVSFEASISEQAKVQIELRRQEFEEFNQGQENVGKVWVAIATILAGMYLTGGRASDRAESERKIL
jgi:amino acid transporter